MSRATAESDLARVTELLGHVPKAGFEVVVRDGGGDPVVIRNDPFLPDGTPLPTLYWLVGRRERTEVGRLEAAGGVRLAESEVSPDALSTAHRRYAAERDAKIPPGWDGPRPAGGVGGARKGVKCLHAHYAWFLAGGDDAVGRWVDARLGSGQPPVAAIDCGTNSTRLLVLNHGGETLSRLMRITRLGEGVDHDKRLSERAVERTVKALNEFRAVMDGLGVGRVRVAATSAVRDATNSELFLDAVPQVVGAAAEILSGEEEGELSYIGATRRLDPGKGPLVTVDIGGGSTELAAAGTAVSVDIGCVRMTERFLHSDPPGGEEIAAARRAVDQALETTTGRRPELLQATGMIGLAGTVAAAATMDVGLEAYETSAVDGHVLSRRAVSELRGHLASMTLRARREVPGLERDRADVIVSGLIVLEAVMAHLDVRECTYSEADILDGLALSLLEAPGSVGRES